MPDIQQYTNILVAGLIVLAVLVIFVLIYKVLNSRVRGRKGTRLGISEFYEIDKARRLVLVRRDDVEHLMLIGGGQDIVIESGIPNGDMPQHSIPPTMAPEDVPQIRPIRPAVFGGQRPSLRPVEPSFDQDGQN
ncbi:MAG: flagellar biosynthetic protein FliO [Proteobacteria bacterium]|nr:flagellar biosynthetic protein FliO [Pseudomonadota bacterium]